MYVEVVRPQTAIDKSSSALATINQQQCQKHIMSLPLSYRCRVRSGRSSCQLDETELRNAIQTGALCSQWTVVIFGGLAADVQIVQKDGLRWWAYSRGEQLSGPSELSKEGFCRTILAIPAVFTLFRRRTERAAGTNKCGITATSLLSILAYRPKLQTTQCGCRFWLVIYESEFQIQNDPLGRIERFC